MEDLSEYCGGLLLYHRTGFNVWQYIQKTGQVMKNKSGIAMNCML